MRVCAAFLLVGTLTAGEAAASSFVSPREIKGGLSRSMIVLGEPSPIQPKLAYAHPEENTAALVPLSYPLPWEQPLQAGLPHAVRVISPSIIAMGEPPVTFEKVAAIDTADKPRRRPSSLPMVIRGGIIGDAFASPAAAPASVPQAERQAVAAPKERPVKPAAPQPPAPQPAAPPPPPTPNLPQLRGVD